MHESDVMTRKTRIAVLGGGLGSLTTVYGLTSTPGWQDRYDITVYQMGWRLGGKGASGRNRREHMRIEEHGLHVWMGFYENAFQMMQACYAERARLDARDGLSNALRTWDDAFKPHNFMVVEECIDGAWKHWPMEFPTNPGVPGDGRDLMTPWQFIVTAINLLREHVAASRDVITHDVGAGEPHEGLLGRLRAIVRGAGHPLEGALLALESGMIVSADLLLEHAAAAAARLAAREGDHHPDDHRDLAWLLRECRDWLGRHLSRAVAVDDRARRFWMQVDMSCTLLVGVLEDGVLFHGFASIDEWEFRDWLRHHGASDLGANNALIDALYEGGFAYVGGDQERPNMGAGAVAQSFLRLYLGYKGSVIYKMQAGMGDVVFAPIYRVLKERGVRFEFFHKVLALRFDEAANAVGRIECERQVALPGPYQPLIRVNDLDAWPSEPDYDQIGNGAALERAIADGRINLESQGSPAWEDATPLTLERGRDYDIAVLGIPIAVLKYICADLVAVKPAWRDMVTHVLTVRTQGVQLWFRAALGATGWPLPSPCLVNYAQPCAAWLDASQVLCRESWPEGEAPGSVAYLCSTLPDERPELTETAHEAFDLQRRWEAKVQAQAGAWLESAVGHLWPSLTRGAGANGLRWDALAAPAAAEGEARLDAQYFRANLDASERYALSVAGSTKHRLAADGSGVDGLYLTGDWIANGFNVGCVESTVIAGLQCSRAISGAPARIIGDPFMRF